MAHIRFVFVIGLMMLAAACDSVDVNINEPDRTPVARVVTLNMDGTMPDQDFIMDGARGSGSIVRSDLSGNESGFRYAFGNLRQSDEFLGVVGIVPGSDPGDAITTGSVSYMADYQLVRATGDNPVRVGGEIQLDASFGTGRIVGADDGFVVDGTFTGQTLGGSVTYDGISADLQGVVGEDRIVGAFAETVNDGFLIGGFMGEAE